MFRNYQYFPVCTERLRIAQQVIISNRLYWRNAFQDYEGLFFLMCLSLVPYNLDN